MSLVRHGIALAIALAVFLCLTLMSGTLGLPALYATGGILVAATLGYFHYRRRTRRQKLEPVSPGRDSKRMPPKDIEFQVILRDGGKCQIRRPGICLVDQQLTIDHIIPWSKGGSSTDMDNLQTACRPCNMWKSDKVLV